MNKVCNIQFRRGSFVYRCDLAYGHDSLCSAAGMLRVGLSDLAQRRFREAQQQLAAAEEMSKPPITEEKAQAPTPPEGPKILDPYVDYAEVLQEHYGVRTDGEPFSANIGGSSITLTANGPFGRVSMTLPMYHLSCFSCCCGVYNLDGWLDEDDEYRPEVIAAFCAWLEYQKKHNPIMGFVCTTNQFQGAAARMLKKCGFLSTTGLNKNSGRRVTIWVYNLKPIEE
jgi:hypothetical protein